MADAVCPHGHPAELACGLTSMVRRGWFWCAKCSTYYGPKGVTHNGDSDGEDRDERIARALVRFAADAAADLDVHMPDALAYPYDAILMHAVSSLVERGYVLRGPASAALASRATQESDR